MSWALVTGGARRLGKEIVLGLASQGHNVAIHLNKSVAEADALVEECKALGVDAVAVHGHFDAPSAVEAFAKRYLAQCPDTHLLVNNVGNYLAAPLQDTSIDAWNSLFQVNLHAPVQLTDLLLPSLKKARGGVINLGCAGLPGLRVDLKSPAYRATKAAMLSWTRSLARELAPDGVTVNMVSPGRMDNSVELTEERIRAIPMGRPGKCNELARIVTFLADPSSEYITGQNIEVAGGLAL